MEEAKSFVIIMDNLNIFLDIALILRRHIPIVKNVVTLLKNVHS